MNKCDFFIKPKNINIPINSEIINYYDQCQHKKITLIYNNGKYIFVDKSCNNIYDLIDVLKNEILKEDNLVIIFHDEDGNYFSDLYKNNCFYKTKQNINISQNNNNCIDTINLINKKKYKALFEMFLKDNSYIEIGTDFINFYGCFENKNGYLTTQKIMNVYPLVLRSGVKNVCCDY